MRLLSNTKFDFVGSFSKSIPISLVFILIGVGSLVFNGGPKLGIDFTGGYELRVNINEYNLSEVRLAIENNGYNQSVIVPGRSTESNRSVLIITTKKELKVTDLEKFLNRDDIVKESSRFIGPSIGNEMKTQAIQAVLMAIFLILSYISLRFDRFYAIGSISALVHDIAITLGIFSVLGYEINLNIIAAFLTILGYSLNDTIVVFDRIRENISENVKGSMDQVANISLNQTLSRTVITSLTTLLVLLTLYLFGGDILEKFAFALLIGVFVGTYSSIFVASPVMLFLEKKYKKIKDS
tara:strand:- start:179 stop:1066 length:888 start_codon:yes stop_codon:yes gene_type:complete